MASIQKTLGYLRRMAPLIAALVLGLLAAILGWYYLRSSEQEIAANLERDANRQRRDVVVAAQPLIKGMPLSPERVAQRSVPIDFVHGDALTPQVFPEFVGRTLTVSVEPGKPILASFFSEPRKVFAEEVAEGSRAITIPVDQISSISGMLRAGDRVDFMYYANGMNDSNAMVVPLLQDVEVRATGQITADQFEELKSRPDAEQVDPYARQSYTTVTVALPPKDAQLLLLAQRQGTLVAALRNPVDRSEVDVGMDEQALTSVVEAFRPNRPLYVPPPVAPSRPRSVEYIIGGSGRSHSVQSPIEGLLQMAQAQQSNTAPAPAGEGTGSNAAQ